MLSAMTDGSLASSPSSLSAGGHDEHPIYVNSSTTARGSAWAGRMIATIAQTPSAPDHREIQLWAAIAVMLKPRNTRIVAVNSLRHLTAAAFQREKATLHRPPPLHPLLTSQ